LSQIYLHQ